MNDALEGLDLGGITAEQAQEEQKELALQIEKQVSSETKPVVDENMAISRKDAALNSLVNFGNLNSTGKEEPGQISAAAKPVYIETKQAAGGFVPNPATATINAPSLAIENSSAPA